MRRYFSTIGLLFSAALLFVACIDDDEVEITLYDDVAITDFQITSAITYTETIDDDGNIVSEPTTVTSVQYYPFSIDHIRGEIYNTDSLPLGIDATKMLCSYSTKNSGIVYIDELMGDSWTYLSTVDTTDFSAPRYLRVFSSDNSISRQYRVTVNIHKEKADEFRWTRMADSPGLAALTGGMKAVATDGRLIVAGTDGTSTLIYATTGDGTWTLTGTTALGPEAYRSLTATADGALMVMDGGVLMRSDDGGATFATVTQDAASPALSQLAGAGRTELYALTADGRVAISTDGGTTWTPDEGAGAGADDETAWLPARDISLSSTPHGDDGDAQYVVMTGNRSTDSAPADEANAVVWRKIVEYDADGKPTGKWIYMNVDSNNLYPLPRLDRLTMFSYGGSLIALGGAGIGGCTAKPLAQMYESRDGGITWKDNDAYYLPTGFDTTATAFAAAADSDNRMWIVCAGSGQVWRGRLNRLGWEKQ